MNEWMIEQLNKWMNEWMIAKIKEQMIFGWIYQWDEMRCMWLCQFENNILNEWTNEQMK